MKWRLGTRIINLSTSFFEKFLSLGHLLYSLIKNSQIFKIPILFKYLLVISVSKSVYSFILGSSLLGNFSFF